MTTATLVGSRKVPSRFKYQAHTIGKIMASRGIKMRSGGADGMDDAWERGYSEHKDLTTIILPEYGFNGRVIDNKNTWCIQDFDPKLIEEAEKMVASIHPFWPLSGFPYWAHIRNCFQVLGLDLQSPSDYLICYAPKRGFNSVNGGTRTAVELAKMNNIPFYNMVDLDHIHILERMFGTTQPDLHFLF